MYKLATIERVFGINQDFVWILQQAKIKKDNLK